MNYLVEISSRAERNLKAIPEKDELKIRSAIIDLEHDPRPPSCKKLRGLLSAYRLRIGSYRIIYEIEDDIL